MITIRNEFTLRQEEAEILFELINYITTEPLSVKKSSILKSSLIMLLYNSIESTSFSVFERIHEELSIHTYNCLSDSIKKIYIEFYFKKNSDKMYKYHLDGTLDRSLKMPRFNEYLKKINLFNGNLDSRKINELFKKYGIEPLKSKNKENLLVIKNKRNKIAHGEESFKEACRSFTLSEIERLKNDTFITINELIDNSEIYLTRKLYLKV